VAQDALAELVEYSRRLGSDSTLVLSGGGNTSVKAETTDITGERVSTLFIKGSGSDLAFAKPGDFTPMRLDALLPLRNRDDMSDEEMVDYLARCKLDPSAPRPSIETLLHAFLPHTSVFHSHADAILSLINSPKPIVTLRDVFKDTVAPVPYRRPGFLLSKEVAYAASGKSIKAVVLLNHGLVTWGGSPADAYHSHLSMIEVALDYLKSRTSKPVFVADALMGAPPATQRHELAARIAPVLRGALSKDKRVVLSFDDSPGSFVFASSNAARSAAKAGAATPDHILTTKVHPLWVDLPLSGGEADWSAAIDTALESYRNEYVSYFERWKTDEPQLETTPRLVLVPGIGLFVAARDLKTARLAGDIYRHTMQIMANAETLGGYRSLSEQEAFRAEYWPLELYKLKLAPPERELARRVAMVTGAGSGLGRAIAQSLAAAGAHVLVTDLNAATAQETAEAIGAPAAHAQLDVTSEASVRAAFQRVALEFGGVDIIVSNAGFAHCASIEQLKLEDWERSLAVNATGHFLITREAFRQFRAQGIGGNIVFVATKNVTAPGADFVAYSASKSAEAQLARVAAIEGGPLGIRVNMVNPDAIFTGSHLWDDIKQRRAQTHGIPEDKMPAHYRERSLLKLEVRAEDVAEAVLFLASDRSSRTTGAMIPVDAGLREAFPR
jgi:rhamnulose-1-phosphate aldolase/alcohol dehydrogenase